MPIHFCVLMGRLRRNYESSSKKKEKEKKRKTCSLARSLYSGGCNNYREKSYRHLIMKKRKSSIKKLNRIGLRSSVSIYKTEFSEYKKMRFHNIYKIANIIAKHFKRLKPFKF